MPLHHVYDSDHYEHGEDALAILKVVYCRDGADVAAQVAKNMIAVATALLTCQYGPDEARRILRIVGEGAGESILSGAIPRFSIRLGHANIFI